MAAEKRSSSIIRSPSLTFVRVTIDLRHLRAFETVVDLGTFGRAAARLGYTQSTVSQQIAALEKSVGGPVFERPGGPRRVRLTPLGSLVLERGRRLTRDADDLRDAVERFHAGPARLDIGTFQSVSTVVLPALVSRLRAERPDCEVRLFEGEPEHPRLADLDLLFYDGPVDDEVTSVKLLDDPYVLVAGPGDFPDGPVPIPRLAGRPVVAWPASCAQPALERMLEGSGARLDIVFRSASNDALLAMVESGVGCAILPRLAVTGVGDRRGLSLHPLDPEPSRELHLHWPRARPLSSLAVRAVEIAQEIAQEVAAGLARERATAGLGE